MSKNAAVLCRKVHRYRGPAIRVLLPEERWSWILDL
jgi:hypothetical protein